MTDKEPVSFHGNSVDWYMEVMHSFWACSFTDCTPLTENAGLASIMTGIPYVGLAFNDFHAEKLRARLVDRVYREFTNPSSRLHQPISVVELLGDSKRKREDEESDGAGGAEGKQGKESEGKGEDGGQPTLKKPRTADTAAKAKAKAKSKAANTDEEVTAHLAKLLDEVNAGDAASEAEGEKGAL